MTATRVASTTEGTDATQAVQRLPGRVFNAENVTMTDEYCDGMDGPRIW